MKYILLFSLISFVSCNFSDPNYTMDGLPLSVDSAVNGLYKQKITYNYDTSIICIIPYDKLNHSFFENCSPTTLSEFDLDSIHKVLTLCIDEFNTQQKNKPIDLNKYKRQYIAVVNSNNEVEVYVNCLCSSPFMDWKKNIVTLKDGDICYFNLKINLNRMEYSDFNINSSA